jgi:hypothetical protein
MTSIRLQALDNSSNPIFTVDPTGGTRILSTDDSTGPTIGALTVYGGLGVSKSIYISNTLNATSISTENIICPNATISTLVMSTVTGGSISVTDNVVSNEGQVRGIFTVGNTGNRLRITTSATGTFIQSGQTAGGTSAPILFTDIFATSNWMSILTSGNIGIGGNTSPSFKLDVIGTGRIPTFISTDITAATITLTTGITSTTALLTIATIPNLITTNITSSTLNLTTGITSASALLTIATIPNLITTNVTTSTLNVTTGITSASALLTIATIPNLTSTNITTGTLNVITGVTSATALLTTATIPDLTTTNITSSTLNITTGITSASAILTTATIPNLTTTNITTGVLNASGITTGPMTITYNSGGAQLYFQRADGTSIHTIKTNVDNSMMINAFGGGASMWLNADTSVFFGKLANTTGSTMSITSSTGANGLVVVNSPFRATTSPATISNLVSTNITSGNAFFTTGITSASAILTTATIPNLTTTNITSSTLNITTGITSASALLTIATIPNLITTDITAATITLTTGITSQSALLTIATIPNLITTNISSSTLLVASRNPASVASFRSVSASTSATVALIELQRDPSSGGDALYGDGSTSNVRCKSSIRLINRTFSTPKQNDAITFNADGIGAAFNLDLNYGFVSILDTRESTGITNGSMVVNGGMAVAKTIYSTNVNTTTFTSGNAFFTTGITSASALLTTATIPNLITTNITSSTLNLTTGITAGTGRFTSITGGTGFFTTGITTGNLTVNTVDSTPTIGDIYKQVSFSGANSQAAAANVIGLTFTNANTRGFKVFVTVVVLATSSLYAFYELDGIQRGADWQMSSARTGDDPIVVFSITTSGQVQYTSSTYAGFTSLTFKFRALTIST